MRPTSSRMPMTRGEHVHKVRYLGRPAQTHENMATLLSFQAVHLPGMGPQGRVLRRKACCRFMRSPGHQQQQRQQQQFTFQDPYWDPLADDSQFKFGSTFGHGFNNNGGQG